MASIFRSFTLLLFLMVSFLLVFIVTQTLSPGGSGQHLNPGRRPRHRPLQLGVAPVSIRPERLGGVDARLQQAVDHADRIEDADGVQTGEDSHRQDASHMMQQILEEEQARVEKAAAGHQQQQQQEQAQEQQQHEQMQEQQQQQQMQQPQPQPQEQLPPTAGDPFDPEGVWAGRADEVKKAFAGAWKAYRQHGNWADNYHPVSQTGSNWGGGRGIGVMTADAMSTMWLMGLTEEFDEAVEWVSTKLSFAQRVSVSRFETTIRVLGGLVSAYQLSGRKHPALLEKARDLCERLMTGHRTSSGFPYRDTLLDPASSSSTGTNLAEVGSEQMEYRSLSYETRDARFATATNRVWDAVDRTHSPHGLYPIDINAASGFVGGQYGIGASADSFYEYLVKLWILSGKTDEQSKRLFVRAVRGILDHLYIPGPGQPGERVSIIGAMHGSYKVPQYGHLESFVGGMLSLGNTSGILDDDPQLKERASSVAEEVGRANRELYKLSPLGIGPETAGFNQGTGKLTRSGASFYILRPETFETWFYLWRATRKPQYREWAWDAFQNLVKWCQRADGSFHSLHSVFPYEAKTSALSVEDKMESFVFAETLKYLYLTFAPDSTLDISKWMFNTEAHPLEVQDPERGKFLVGGRGA
eukprot:TRINITY_DN310_c0_g1_i1.p1 TRINITY_DN310_c0_g1~~TRINITY_DN310_c0_g1_i1.p1  ORF type:complete len:641 (+),score=170.15 TRINITY_DN310_c0_g1_i1:286-2208(+)